MRPRPPHGPRARLPLFSLAALLAASGCGTTAPARRAAPASADEDPAPPRRIALFTVVPQSVADDGRPVDLPALVPLACYEEGRLAGGTLCLGMVPARTPLAMGEAGDRVVSAGRTRPHCEGEITRDVALGLADYEPGTYAVWPAAAHREFSPVRPGAAAGASCQGWCSFDRTGHPRVRAPAALRSSLSRTLAPLLKQAGLDADTEALQVVQQVEVDLDGDGAPERFTSVALPDAEQGEYAFAFSALLVANGKRPQERWVLRRQDTAAVVLRGTLDLDQDGTREMWLMLSPTSGGGEAHEVVTLVPGEQAALVGGYGCYPAGT